MHCEIIVLKRVFRLVIFYFFRVKLIQWNSDAYDQDLVQRTRDACKGDIDVVLGCLGLGAPLQRSFKCLKKGGTAFVTEEINEKVLKSLEKMAEQQNKFIQIVKQGNTEDLKALLNLVADEIVSTNCSESRIDLGAGHPQLQISLRLSSFALF